ncbi:hypothetical protein C0992_013366, partial [Termitomyces sp. T32_za158]
RSQPSYAPDVQTKVVVEDMNHKLLVDFVDDEQLVLAQGERKELNLWLFNAGDRPIREIWMVAGPEDEIWLGQDEGSDDTSDDESRMLKSSSTLQGTSISTEVIQSHNSLEPRQPLRIPLEINPGERIEYPIQIHADVIGNQSLNLLFVYREVSSCVL